MQDFAGLDKLVGAIVKEHGGTSGEGEKIDETRCISKVRRTSVRDWLFTT